jgi:ATP-dependent Clp protease ATP-binding subunit ClpC
MTSNLGSNVLKRAEIGLTSSKKDKSKEEITLQNEQKLDKVLKDYFRPEFLNRIDEVVVFSNLSKEDIAEIVKIQIDKTIKMLKDQGVKLNILSSAMDYLVNNGYSEEYGARPLKRLIQKEIENKLSEMIISDEIVSGNEVEIGVLDGKLDFKVKVPENAEILN